MTPYSNQTLQAMVQMGREAERWTMACLFGFEPTPMPVIKTPCCNASASVRQPDYYAGLLSCDACRRVLSVSEIDSMHAVLNLAQQLRARELEAWYEARRERKAARQEEVKGRET